MRKFATLVVLLGLTTFAAGCNDPAAKKAAAEKSAVNADAKAAKQEIDTEAKMEKDDIKAQEKIDKAAEK